MQKKDVKIEDAIDKLNSVFEGKLKCPMCGNSTFEVVDGFCSFGVTYDIGNKAVRSIPVSAFVCERCGFVSFHALGALGLMRQ